MLQKHTFMKQQLNTPSKDLYRVDDKVTIINDEPLPGNDKKPAVKIGEAHVVKNITVDKEGFQHLDLGLKSNYNYVRSFETKEELKDGDKIHWVSTRRVTKK